MLFKFQLEIEGTKVILETQAVTTADLCKEFKNFLSGCGYSFTLDEEILVWDHSLTKFMEEGAD